MSSELDDELLELVGGSSDKEKQTQSRKRNREAGGGGKGKKPSKKRKVAAAADSDNEPESEEGDGDEELYPLEGKYIDEQDRADLLAKTEIEREEILTARLDEVERIRDRKHVDKLRAQQLAGVAAVESGQQHQNGGGDGAKRQPRTSGKDKTKDKTLSALKAKRKAKDEKKLRVRASNSSPKARRSSSPMDMDMSDSDASDEDDDEDGQITRLEQEDERLFGKKPRSGAEKDGKGKEPEVDLPLTSEHLLKIALSRDALAKHSASPWFAQIVTGGWVRYCIGSDAERNGEQVYRLCQIISVVPSPKPYKIDNKTVRDVFVLKHGKAEKTWQMDRTSNSPWTQDEFKRMVDTCANEKIPVPTRKEVDERFGEMQDLIGKVITEDDVSAMIARKRLASTAGGSGSGTATPVLSVAERSRLNAQRTLAQRRQDYDEVREIDAQLAAAAAAASLSAAKTTGEEELQDRLARVNERNRKANAESIRKAEMLEAERKKRERKSMREGGGVIDPSARLRTVPRLWESATPTSRPSTPNPATLGVSGAGANGAKPTLSPSPAPTPPTGGKTFEAAIIESIEVDLGDF
ncbi:hypothetical protein DFH08DRAFT_889034 [Mycena albidolilacea]|uniref:Plus3 domain-containing protein n=1 Tax=Mycena albidolilacea TaxID=1033008 RepID=A0AAD6ZGZ2_9AGAR|nr:hypothetical protein DFH08DRAFT_889034 [Mycena albidolilacea]